MKRDADYCAMVFGLQALEGYIPGYEAANANFRRALDPEACSAPAPLARRLRTALQFTYERYNKAEHYVSVAGSLEALLTIHLLAHTSTAQAEGRLATCFLRLEKAGIPVPYEFKYAKIRATEVRRYLEEEREEIPKRAAAADAKCPIQSHVNSSFVDDEGLELTHAYEFDSPPPVADDDDDDAPVIGDDEHGA